MNCCSEHALSEPAEDGTDDFLVEQHPLHSNRTRERLRYPGSSRRRLHDALLVLVCYAVPGIVACLITLSTP